MINLIAVPVVDNNSISSSIMAAIISMMMVVIITTIYANCNNSCKGKIRWVITVMIGWNIRYINR